MIFTIVCQACDESWELEYSQLAEGTRGVRCPGCSKRVPANEVDEIVSSLDELLEQVAALRKRFALSFEVDADDLPPPFDTDRRRAKGEDAEEETEEDEDADEDDEASEDDDEAGDEDDEDRF